MTDDAIALAAAAASSSGILITTHRASDTSSAVPIVTGMTVRVRAPASGRQRWSRRRRRSLVRQLTQEEELLNPPAAGSSHGGAKGKAERSDSDAVDLQSGKRRHASH